MKLSLRNLDLKGKKVLMRVDFNVPLTKDGTVRDDSRIRLTLPSIEYILNQGGKLILMSHLGRPSGKKDPKLSLNPIARHLEKILDKPVLMAADCIGPEIEKQAACLDDGSIMLLENVRFYPGEEHPDETPSFAKNLAKLGDLYVNDAFGTSHRMHTSTALLADYFPKKSALGFLMEREVSHLSTLISNPERPFYAIIGGAKVGSKIGVLKSLSKKVDALFIGGGMAFTFLKSQGIPIGDSLYEESYLETATSLLKSCKESNVQVFLPEDFLITEEFSNDSEIKIASASEGIPPGWQGLDIGPNTVDVWNTFLKKSASIFWNGPMGVFEFPNFAKGTHALAQSLASFKSSVIVGGGDSIAAINELGIQKEFTHISTGGGAALEYIEFGHLPGIDALSDLV